MIEPHALVSDRRRTLLALAAPGAAALTVACVSTPPEEPPTTIRNPSLDVATTQLLLRHVNTLAVGVLPVQADTRVIEVFWSQSCGDTMRAYSTQMRPVLRSPPRGTVVLLHLVARGTADVSACVAIRAVNGADYGRAVQAVLEAGSAKGSHLRDAEVAQAIARFPKNGGGFKPMFAENCVKLAQTQILAAGITQTPWVRINGRNAHFADLANLS